MYNASGRLLGKPRTTSSEASVPGLWTMQQQIEAKRASLWPAELWTPEDITTALWLDAADASTITESGGAVSQWDDKSGNDRHAAQGLAAQQPVYTANGINGNPSLTFANTAKSLLMPSSVFATNPKVFIVLKSTTSSQAQMPLRLQGSISEFFLILNATSSNQLYFTRRGLEQRPVTHTVTNVSIYFADLFSTSIGDYYINGTLATKQNSIGNAGGSSNANVIGVDNGNINRFQGDLAEYIVLPSVDTDTRQKLEGYLAWKWGLEGELPADHPYKVNPPVL